MVGKKGDAAAGEQGPGRGAEGLSPRLPPPPPPGCLGRCCRGGRPLATLAHRGDERAIGTPTRSAAAGSKRSGLRAQPYGRQQVWAREVTGLKGALATPPRDGARPGCRAPRPGGRDSEQRGRCLGDPRSGDPGEVGVGEQL